MSEAEQLTMTTNWYDILDMRNKNCTIVVKSGRGVYYAEMSILYMYFSTKDLK